MYPEHHSFRYTFSIRNRRQHFRPFVNIIFIHWIFLFLKINIFHQITCSLTFFFKKKNKFDIVDTSGHEETHNSLSLSLSLPPSIRNGTAKRRLKVLSRSGRPHAPKGNQQALQRPLQKKTKTRHGRGWEVIYEPQAPPTDRTPPPIRPFSKMAAAGCPLAGACGLAASIGERAGFGVDGGPIRRRVLGGTIQRWPVDSAPATESNPADGGFASFRTFRSAKKEKRFSEENENEISPMAKMHFQ